MAEAKVKNCFVVTPMSDVVGDQPGHWDRVYAHLLRPACIEAGFEPIRADSAKKTSIIMVDVLRELYSADMVLCDVSGLRANVFFELGLRQAFNRPVVIVRDERTERPFDVASLRDWQYESSLRVDLVGERIAAISKALRETAAGENQSSLVQLLNLEPAKVPGGGSGEQDQLGRITTALDVIADKVEGIDQRLRAQPSARYVLEATGTGSTGPLPLRVLSGNHSPDMAAHVAAQRAREAVVQPGDKPDEK